MKKKVAVLHNAKSDIQTFLDELHVLVSFMEEQLQKAPETVNLKKPGDKPMPQI